MVVTGSESPSPYTVERAPGYITTLQLHRWHLIIPGPTTTPDWKVGDSLSAVDADPGMQIVEGDVDESVGTVEYLCRDGRRQITVSSDVVHECLSVDKYSDVTVYDGPTVRDTLDLSAGEPVDTAPGSLRVVPTNPDPLVELMHGGDADVTG